MNKKGFSLLEIVIVMVVIGLIFMVVFSSSGQIRKQHVLNNYIDVFTSEINTHIDKQRNGKIENFYMNNINNVNTLYNDYYCRGLKISKENKMELFYYELSADRQACNLDSHLYNNTVSLPQFIANAKVRLSNISIGDNDGVESFEIIIPYGGDSFYIKDREDLKETLEIDFVHEDINEEWKQEIKIDVLSQTIKGV